MAGYPEHLELGPFASAVGELRLPGSKSISNRVLLLAALAQGSTEIHDLLSADDVDRMLDSLVMLGVRLEKGKDPGRVTISGCGGPFPVKSAELFLGNAGTAFRPMTAALALCGGHYRLSGAARMHERPIGDLVSALRQLGAELHYLGREGLPPLEIRPGKIRDAGTVRMSGEVSSQFLTALLMALPITGKQTTIEVVGELISKPYVEITLNVMARFGVQVRRTGWTSFTIPAGSRYRSPGKVFVEGDASGASYFLAAGAIAGGPVRVVGVGRTSVQGDVQFASVLADMGAHIEMGETWIEARAPASGRLRAFDLDLNHIPDAAMTLAVTALFADGTSRLRNIASWRVKETDRITAMATELRKVGAIVEEGADYLVVTPPDAYGLTSLASIDTYDDHRMAMCFALVAFGGVQVRINNPACVAKTFPDFFERFAGIAAGAPVPVIAIDGPSASGKGTVARQLAQRIGFHYLDSGALYRLVALAAMRQGIAIQDAAALGRLAHSLPIQIRDDCIGLGNEDVTEAIRAEDVSALASKVATISQVRQGLIGRQRAFRRPPGLVADGRDMGTVVFPDAVLKVFLTASAEERALRRYKQLIDKGFDANLATLLQEISQRDSRDSARSVAPLQKSVDAQVLDTTGLSVKEAVAQVVQWFESVQRRAPSR